MASLGEKLDPLPVPLASGSPRWLTIQAAADYCGLSAESIRRLLSARKLTAHRPVKGRILIDRGELDALIQAKGGESGSFGDQTIYGYAR